MKKLQTLFAVLLMFVPVLMGMGSPFGQSSPEKIPVPAKKFAVTFVDQMDVVTECTDASIEGGTFIEGKRGDGNNTISFDLIDNISLFLNADTLTGVVKLRDGNVVELTVKKDQKVYGHNRYGTFQIRLADLKKIIFSKASQKKD
jgi:hypothetical protein